MVGTLLGGRMANALKRVEVESNIESERAQIHLQVPEERIARDLDRVNQAENAAIKIAPVSMCLFKDWSVPYRKFYFPSAQRKIKKASGASYNA